MEKKEIELTTKISPVTWALVLLPPNGRYNDASGRGPNKAMVLHNGSFAVIFSFRLYPKVSNIGDVHFTLGGIASICFRFYFQQTLRIQIQGCQGCQKTRNFMRNSKILIARSTIQPKLSKIKNNLPFFKEF